MSAMAQLYDGDSQLRWIREPSEPGEDAQDMPRWCDRCEHCLL